MVKVNKSAFLITFGEGQPQTAMVAVGVWHKGGSAISAVQFEGLFTGIAAGSAVELFRECQTPSRKQLGQIHRSIPVWLHW